MEKQRRKQGQFQRLLLGTTRTATPTGKRRPPLRDGSETSGPSRGAEAPRGLGCSHMDLAGSFRVVSDKAIVDPSYSGEPTQSSIGASVAPCVEAEMPGTTPLRLSTKMRSAGALGDIATVL